MLVLNRTSDAATEPVTVAELKANVRFPWNTEDALIGTLITAARQHIEEITCRSFITQTWELKLDWGFPAVIELPRPPVIALSSFTYVDTNGTSQTVSSDVYTIDTSAEPARIYEAYNENWPDTRHQRSAVTVTYTAGYGAASAVPARFVQATKLLAAHWFRSREAGAPVNMSEIPFGVRNLISTDLVFAGA